MVGGKHTYKYAREQFADQKSGGRNTTSCDNTQSQCPFYAVVVLCSVVISGNRLHSHGNSHHDHHEQHLYPVKNAECSDRKVAAVSQQAVVDENHDTAGTYVHYEGRHAYAKDVQNDLFPEFKTGTLEAYVTFLVVEMI